MKLTDEQIAEYRERGYLAVPGVFGPDEVREPQAVTDAFVERSREVTEHTEVFDLEPGHTAEQPRLRRLKTPHRQHPAYDRALRNERLLALLRGLLGDSVRHLNTKLNLKSPEFGSPAPDGGARLAPGRGVRPPPGRPLRRRGFPGRPDRRRGADRAGRWSTSPTGRSSTRGCCAASRSARPGWSRSRCASRCPPTRQGSIYEVQSALARSAFG